MDKAKAREREKAYRKRVRKKEPFIFIGEDIADSARQRGFERPHKPKEYRDWFYATKKICHYCGSDHETINKYLKKIGIKKQFKRLSIDRLDSKKGYLISNIVLACYICNCSRSNIISAKDFKEIALKYIRPKIKKV